MLYSWLPDSQCVCVYGMAAILSVSICTPPLMWPHCQSIPWMVFVFFFSLIFSFLLLVICRHFASFYSTVSLNGRHLVCVYLYSAINVTTLSVYSLNGLRFLFLTHFLLLAFGEWSPFCFFLFYSLPKWPPSCLFLSSPPWMWPRCHYLEWSSLFSPIFFMLFVNNCRCAT
jgi:hypothetical protein